MAAAPEQVPAALVDQLKPSGRMVIPVGRRYSGQDLKLIEKDETGGITVRNVLPVAFVPLTGSRPTVIKPKTKPKVKKRYKR
jgi:protein-L-isoaspartate(D-aspartate) O-methyltransferase